MRSLAACSILLLPAMAGEAAAQSAAFSLVARGGPGIVAAPRTPSLPHFGMSRLDWREAAGEAPRGGLIATVPLAPDLQVALGRFTVVELARPRTHTETERRPADVRRRDNGIAAVGISYRF
jgi:hypothetical protein